jgi:hypothetical protein
MKGIKRGTHWGYSLWAFEVYDLSYAPTSNLALYSAITASSSRLGPRSPENAIDSNSATRWESEWGDDQWIYVDLGAIKAIGRVILRWETAYGEEYQIQVSDDAKSWTTIYHEMSGDGGVDDIRQLRANGRYVRMKGIRRGTQWGYSLWEFGVYDGHGTNLALHGKATASSSIVQATNQAVDGNTRTRWASEWSDDQWIYVDLGAVRAISRVILRWETAYGKEYLIQVSDDAQSWTTIYHETNGDGGVDDIRRLRASGRYVRMKGIKRGTQWGYSLWEFEVYDS